MDPQLEAYIKQAKASGQTDAQIMQSLLSAGWNQTLVNEAFGIQQYSQPKKKKHYFLRFFIFILILAILAGGGYHAYKSYYSSDNRKLTYNDKTLNFQFEYPSNLEISETQLDATTKDIWVVEASNPNLNDWDIFVSKQGSENYLMSCQDYEDLALGGGQKVSNTTISGISAKKIQSYYSATEIPYTTTLICAENGGITYAFSTTYDGSSQNHDYSAFDKMIFSIKINK